MMGKKVYEIKEDEQLFAEKVTGDCWKMPNTSINRQVSGKYYFTDKRIAFLASGLIGTESVSWEIEMTISINYLFLKEKNILIGYVNIWHENNITYHLQNIFKTEQGENVDIELVNAIAFDSYTHGYYEVIQ